MEKLLSVLLSGAMIGMVYGLVGLCYALVYKASGYINLALGEFVMLGVLGTAGFMVWWDLPFPAAAALAILLAGALGASLEFFVLRRMRNPTLLRALIITVGFAFFVHGLARLMFGTLPRSLPAFPGPPSSISVVYDRAVLPGQALYIVALVLVVFAASALFLARTRLGRQMRAVAVDPEMAQAFGISAGRLILIVFATSAALAALLGVTFGSVIYMTYESGTLLGLKGLVAAIVGGISRPGGAIWGGLVLGLTETFAAGYLIAGWQDGAAFVLLIVVLLVRPQGLFANKLQQKEAHA